MRAVEVSPGISWVGAVDWELRDFHGFETPRGSTYNAYVVQGHEKTALVDTVKQPFVPELLLRLRTVVDPEKIDLIVVNHVEPDHNSGLRDVMAACPNARVVASRAGQQGVAEYHDGLHVDIVGADDVIDLGGRSLHFLPMPMVHWPDSMFTFCPESCTLMPNDAFGQHLATSQRFADEVGLDFAFEQLGIYFANILTPLTRQVAKAVEKVVEAGWDCRTIAPSHGVIWRGDAVPQLLEHYDRWSSGFTRERAVVAFGTMWGSTDILARAIADGIAEEGVEVFTYDLAVSQVSAVTYKLLESRALVLGSSTLHHGMLYRVAGYLQYLKGLEPKGKVAATFGSFGWGGGACKEMKARLTEIGFECPYDEFVVKYKPTDDDVRAAEEWGREIGRGVKAR